MLVDAPGEQKSGGFPGAGLQMLVSWVLVSVDAGTQTWVLWLGALNPPSISSAPVVLLLLFFLLFSIAS